MVPIYILNGTQLLLKPPYTNIWLVETALAVCQDLPSGCSLLTHRLKICSEYYLHADSFLNEKIYVKTNQKKQNKKVNFSNLPLQVIVLRSKQWRSFSRRFMCLPPKINTLQSKRTAECAALADGFCPCCIHQYPYVH